MRTRIVNPVARAFTLIEILIVVVILGILAAIVIPQFSESADDAMESSVRSQLQTVRSQVELFKFRDPTGFTATDETNLFVNLIAGDYLQQAPRNPFHPTATATSVGALGEYDNAWVWDGDNFTASDGLGSAFDEDGDGAPAKLAAT